MKIPTYKEALDLTLLENSPFYESKCIIDGYNISVFNYRLASYNDFNDNVGSKEMRGLTFVFNDDGTIFNRYLLLEKFFNLNEEPNSMYSNVKNYKIKSVSNKEDGSIATFIKLPNGKIIGKTKNGFSNDQSNGINRVYSNNNDIKKFVEFTLNNNIIPIFEYVAPSNRIVLRYKQEELILLKLRDNLTGKYLDMPKILNDFKSIKTAYVRNDFENLKDLIDIISIETDREGDVIQFDNNGCDFFVKIKTPWYVERHTLLTNDIYHENIIIKLILEDKIDDIIGHIPEDEVETKDRIFKIINIIKRVIKNKIIDIQKLYDIYLTYKSDKDFAIKYHKDENFSYVMTMSKCDKLKKLSLDEILEIYDTYDDYQRIIDKGDINQLVISYILEKTKKLEMARNFIGEIYE